MEILKGHTSPETAYVVNDYPYGFRLRCRIRYWIEYRKGHGCRFVSQTTNPKKAFDPATDRRPEPWNKPKASTYHRFGATMLRDPENGRISYTGLGIYTDAKEAREWAVRYGEGLVPEARIELEEWIRKKEIYEAKRAEGIEMQDAAIQTIIETSLDVGDADQEAK